jgi:hypothetical protein
MISKKILGGKKFNLTYLFYAEEPGSDIYETNDRAGLYFHDRYIVEQNNEETCYYTELQETLNDIAERTDKTCEYWENAQKIVEDFNREHEDNRITLIKIEVL